MKVSYGVVWRELGPRRVGRLTVASHSLKLVAVDDNGVAARNIPFEEIERVDVREPAQEGEHAIVLVTLRDGETVEIATTVDRWILADLAGKVPIAENAVASGAELHEWHPGLGL